MVAYLPSGLQKVGGLVDKGHQVLVGAVVGDGTSPGG
jgi:hypothetical protein